MRKKSHITLARHILNVSEHEGFIHYKKAFYVGSILPDCKPTFLTRKHEINGTIDIVEKWIRRLTTDYVTAEKMKTRYFRKLGEVLHYVADYFTYPHNKEYPEGFTGHCFYEGELKHKLRAYVRQLNEKDINNWKNRIKLEKLNDFKDTDDIIAYIKKEHDAYIKRYDHNVDEDCKYIVGVCSKVAFAILHVCERNMDVSFTN